jgi:restriction system protein
VTARDAALVILKDAGRPLSAKDIAEQMLRTHLWRTRGKTPAATVAARLYSDIKKHGDASPFVQVGPNTFGFREGAVDATAKAVVAKPPRTKKQTAEKYSFTDAAEKVLGQFGDKKPMHYREVTEKALELGWIATEGKTPEATMYAQVLTEIRRYQKRGEQPRFVQHGRGFMGLSKWMGKGLEFQINQHNKRIRKELHKRLHAMDATEFEQFVGHRLLADLGFEDIEVTKRCKDGGIDVRGTLVVEEVIRIRMAVQVKKWKHSIGTETVQQVRGSLGTHEQGLIITTGDFSPRARTEAARPNAVPVALMNGEQLVALLADKQIGIARTRHDIFELASEGMVNDL